MNELKNSHHSDLEQTAPLFASSWVALFLLLRKGMVRDRADAGPVASPKGR